MKVLELFAGTRSIGKAFESGGHEVFSVEWSKDFENIDLYEDISKVTAEDILRLFGKPDVIWASPDCSTFSIAAISHHRRKNPETGSLEPVSAYAKFCDMVDQHVLKLIEELQPKYYFIENPRGGMRKMEWMKGLSRYTVTYCQYGDNRMKPTDIWTNHPDPKFLPMCHNGDSCHVAAPRGSKTGTQGLKVRKGFYIEEDLLEQIDGLLEQADVKSRNEFLNQALKFYIGYLTSEKIENYMLSTISSVMHSTVKDSENRMARVMYKLAVETSKLSHVIAYSHGVDEEALKKLQAKCTDEVKRINGAVTFEDAYRFQNE